MSFGSVCRLGFERVCETGAHSVRGTSLTGQKEKDHLANAITQVLIFNSQFHFLNYL
jgi:hypothetical protein